jgi:hypothetical protein
MVNDIASLSIYKDVVNSINNDLAYYVWREESRK